MQPNSALLPYALCAPEDVFQLIADKKVVVGEALETVTQLINLFTEMMQGPNFLNRELEVKERTEYFDIESEYWSPLVTASPCRVQVKAPPIAVDSSSPPVPVIQVWNSSERIYDSSTLQTLYSAYTVDVKRGWVKSVSGYWATGPNAIKITYTGGLVKAPANAQQRPTGPPDLRTAAAMQVASWYQRRKDLGVDAMSFPQGGAIQLSDPTKLLRHVALVIQRYRVFRGVS